MRELVVTLLFALVPIVSFSQDNQRTPDPVPHNILKLAPFQFLVQTLEVSIETINRDYTSAFQFGLAYRSGHVDFEEGRGGAAYIAYRKYVKPFHQISPFRSSQQGVYYSLLLKGEIFKGKDSFFFIPGSGSATPPEETYTSAIPAVCLGLHKTIFEVLLLDVYFGGGIRITHVDIDGPEYDDGANTNVFHPGYDGIYPMIGLRLGVGL